MVGDKLSLEHLLSSSIIYLCMFTKILSVARLTFKSMDISFDPLLLYLINSIYVEDESNFI